jgi:hypothetical protein
VRAIAANSGLSELTPSSSLPTLTVRLCMHIVVYYMHIVETSVAVKLVGKENEPVGWGEGRE